MILIPHYSGNKRTSRPYRHQFGCGIGQCGACTMHLNGQSIRSCSTPIITAAGQEITTIEGIFVGETLHVDQQAWVDEQVPQCGYCQSGQIISVVALLTSNSNPTDEEIDQAMSGNICRRHTCSRIRKGIKFATMRLNENLTVERNG